MRYHYKLALICAAGYAIKTKLGTVPAPILICLALASLYFFTRATLLYPHGSLLLKVKSVSGRGSIVRRIVATMLWYSERFGRFLKDKDGNYVLHVFHDPSDSHCYLLLQGLDSIVRRFKVRLVIHIVNPLRVSNVIGYGSDANQIWRWMARDARSTGSVHKLKVPFTSDGAVYNIDQERLAEDTRLADVHLCKYLHSIGGANGQSLDQQQSLAFIEHALAVSDRLFDQHSPAQTLVEFLQHTENEMKMDGGSAVDAEMEQIIIDNYAFMKARGHYLPGVTYMQPTFYWGVDRLFYLEKRLHELDLARDSNDSGAIVFNQNYTLRINAMSEEEIQSMKAMMGTKKEPSHDLVMYYSFRSPYSQLAIERFYDVARAWGVNPVIKPVLPMAMRKSKTANTSIHLPKQMYILLDTIRESKQVGFPWIAMADPLGIGVERCFALWVHYSGDKAKQEAFLRSFGVLQWGLGWDMATDRGAQKIVETAGLDWKDAKSVLDQNNNRGPDAEWRKMEEKNLAELKSWDLWGVPSFQYGDQQWWGQDRFRSIEDAIVDDLMRD